MRASLRSQTSRHVALLLGISALTFFLNLGVPRLWDRDEPRNAGASLGMLQSGDWVVPYFNGDLRVHKPVLINWFMASAFAVFDDPEFAARFWSAGLAAGAVLMTYGIGRRLFNASAGLWGGVVLASNLQFAMMGRAATPEMLFTFFLTGAMLVYVLGTFRPKDPSYETLDPALPRDRAPDFFPAWPVAALMYAVMGVAVLAKGPAGLVLPTAVVGLFLLIMRLPGRPPEAAPARGWQRLARWLARVFAPGHFLRTAWSMRPITALIAAGVMALPWYVAVWYATDPHGAWVKGFLFEHNLGRAARPMEGHGGSLLVYPLTVLTFYPLTILVGLLPWSLLTVPVAMDLAKRLKRRDPWHAGYVFLLCWAGVYVVAFSLVRTKLPSYMTPIYPAVALATGCFLHHWVRGRAAAPQKSVTDAMLVGMSVGIATVLVLPLVIWLYKPFAPLRRESWLALLGLIPVVGAVLTLRQIRRGDMFAAGRAFATTAVLAVVAVFAVGVVRVDKYQHSGPVIQAIRARSDSPRIATFNRLEPSWVFYSQQTLKDYKKTPDAAAFLASGPDAFIITSDEKLPQIQPGLPDGVGVVVRVPYFGRKGEILVIGREDGSAGVAESPRSGADNVAVQANGS